MALRDDQIMAQALCDWAIKNIRPPASLRPMVKRNLGIGKDAYLAATNLGHMAAGLNLALEIGKPVEQDAVKHLIDKVYKFNFEAVFRTVFEGQSVNYSGYNSLTPTALLVRYNNAVVRMLAREFLRWDYTIQALCSTVHGRVVMPCGRTYDPKKIGTYSAATDYRQRAIQGISDDGWWPPKGVGPKYWSDPSSVSARPWKDIPALPSLVFDADERAALRMWVIDRTVSNTLRVLINPIRIYQGFHVARVDGGHVGWMENLQSYKAGANTAQPLVWAQGDLIKKAVVVDPHCGVTFQDSDQTWRDQSGNVISGFPKPQTPHIYIGPNGPEYDL